MSDTKDTKGKAYDPDFLLKALVEKMKARGAEVEQRVISHIQAVSGHGTLPAFHNNGDTPEAKCEVYRDCIKAVLTNDFSNLKGEAPKGQAKPAEPQPEPKPEPAKASAPATVTPNHSDLANTIAAAIAAAMGPKPQAVVVDEAKIRQIAESIVMEHVSGKLMEMQRAAMDRVDKYLAKIPPRDVVEIRKWDGTVNEIKGASHKQLPTIIKALTAVNSIGWSEFLYVWGAPGAGKTHLLRQIGQAIGVKHYPYPCGPTTTEGKMLGYNNIANGDFVKGWLYDPYKNGGLVGMDEIDLADASVLAGANSIENDEFTFGNGETVKRHKDFYLIAFANTIGTGATGGFVRNRLDAATLNRFTHLKLEYDEELESRIFGNPKWTSYVIKVRGYVAKNCNNSIYITPRASRKGAALLKAGFKPSEVCDMVLFGLCSDEVKQNITKNVGEFKP